MKTLKTYAVIILVLVGFPAISQDINGRVKVIETNAPNLFVFKVNAPLKGAKVEMIHSSGEKVTSQTLEKRKMIIDFCDTKPGSYSIRISKGSYSKEFAVSNDYGDGVLLSHELRNSSQYGIRNKW